MKKGFKFSKQAPEQARTCLDCGEVLDSPQGLVGHRLLKHSVTREPSSLSRVVPEGEKVPERAGSPSPIATPATLKSEVELLELEKKSATKSLAPSSQVPLDDALTGGVEGDDSCEPA